MTGTSCLNGWTCGDIAASASDVASFYYEFLRPGGPLVNATSRAEMLKFKSFTTGWARGLPYGMGLMPEGYYEGMTNQTAIVGHGGQDWGSGSQLAGYNFALDFGIVVSQGSATGMNCSIGGGPKKSAAANFDIYTMSSCLLLNTTLAVVSNGTAPHLKCRSRTPPYGVYCEDPFNSTSTDLTLPTREQLGIAGRRQRWMDSWKQAGE